MAPSVLKRPHAVSIGHLGYQEPSRTRYHSLDRRDRAPRSVKRPRGKRQERRRCDLRRKKVEVGRD